MTGIDGWDSGKSMSGPAGLRGAILCGRIGIFRDSDFANQG